MGYLAAMSYPDKNISSLDRTYLKYQMAKYVFTERKKVCLISRVSSVKLRLDDSAP